MKVMAKVQCNTVGDLLDRLAEIATDPKLSSVLDATIEGSDTYCGFKIVQYVLSDKSKILNFELYGD